MGYSLDELAADCRAALRGDSGRAGREQVLRHLRRALTDDGFRAAQLGAEADKPRQVVYEDPELGFCICVHVYQGAQQGEPHDHGPTWAIYGQAEGETEMSDWRVVTPADGDTPGTVEKVRSYRLKPGDAHLYEVGDVHAPRRDGPTKLVRIEGRNTDRVRRTPLRPA